MSETYYVDREHNLIRCIAQYDKASQQLVKRIQLADFDLREFQQIWKISDPEDYMKANNYRLTRENMLQIQRYLASPVEFNFSRFVYFLESYTNQFAANPLIHAWKQATKELSLQAQFDLPLHHPVKGLIEVPLVLLKYYGSPKGTIILPFESDGWIIDECHDQGYYISSLSDDYFSSHNLIDFLESLGWYGSQEKKPDCHRG